MVLACQNPQVVGVNDAPEDAAHFDRLRPAHDQNLELHGMEQAGHNVVELEVCACADDRKPNAAVL